ncbi:MAG: thiol-disulfide oxidoreductase DCC family protein [Bacteroidota bacterium]
MKAIIFDGVCTLCNASVDFLMRKDKQGVFKFASNQSAAGQELLAGEAEGQGEVNTIFFYDEGQLYRRSTAVLRLSRYLGFPWKLGYGLLIVPRPLRDWIYNWIARNRYKWFGKKDTCRMPSPEERERFL